MEKSASPRRREGREGDGHEEREESDRAPNEEEHKAEVFKVGPARFQRGQPRQRPLRRGRAHQSTMTPFSSPSLLLNGTLALLLLSIHAQGRLMARKMRPRMRNDQGTPKRATRAEVMRAKTAPPTPAPA